MPVRLAMKEGTGNDGMEGGNSAPPHLVRSVSSWNEAEAAGQRMVEVFAQITAIARCLELAQRTSAYMARNFNVALPAQTVGNLPELPQMLQRLTQEQAWGLAVDLFRQLLSQVPEDAPPALRKRLDLFDTTFGLGLNQGRANSLIATRRYGISREAWEQAQDRLCKSLGIPRPTTRNSKQDTTRNRLRNYRHVRNR